MRSLLVAAALVLAVVSSPARADAPPAARVAAQPPSRGVHYHELSRMLRRFRMQAESRARARVLAAR